MSFSNFTYLCILLGFGVMSILLEENFPGNISCFCDPFVNILCLRQVLDQLLPIKQTFLQKQNREAVSLDTG